jgi:starvation-inducible DNA-binding protein
MKKSAKSPAGKHAAKTSIAPKALAKASASAKIVKSTKIDLASNARTKVIGLLNDRLADGIDLALVTKQAHWNLKGPGFIGIHLMLDGFRKRARQPCRYRRRAHCPARRHCALAPRRPPRAATSSRPIRPIVTVPDHLAALIERYAATANLVREAIDATDEAGDAGTADLLTAYSRMLDKALWFLQSSVAA